MNVASLENCKRLYELSGWESANDHSYYDGRLLDDYVYSDYETFTASEKVPAYDAGYLLRKLPETTQLVKRMQEHRDGKKHDYRMYGYHVYYRHYENDGHESGIPNITSYRKQSYSLENALCLLAIELFEKGVLVRGDV